MTTQTLLLLVAVMLVLKSPASAEFLMQEREGVLYVKNVEPPSTSFTPRPAPATPSADSYRNLIREAAERHAVAPGLVESVIRVESNFEARAVSPKGARGLMQLMPQTAAQLGVRNAFDVRENIDGGVRHLRYLLDLYRGNVSLALAAYNAGVEAVAKYRGIPPYAETQAYVARILGLLERAGVSTVSGPAVRPAPTTLYRYEAPDGRVVYSNVPLESLSSATRAMLKGQE